MKTLRGDTHVYGGCGKIMWSQGGAELFSFDVHTLVFMFFFLLQS